MKATREIQDLSGDCSSFDKPKWVTNRIANAPIWVLDIYQKSVWLNLIGIVGTTTYPDYRDRHLAQTIFIQICRRPAAQISDFYPEFLRVLAPPEVLLCTQSRQSWQLLNKCVSKKLGSQNHNTYQQTNLVFSTSTNDQRVIMIILEEVAEPTKEDKFNGLTLRHLQSAHTRSTPSLLPDYATSEAQHRNVAIPSSKFKLDAKSWRAALIALCVYTFLTLTIAVPIIVLVSLFLWYNVL